VKYKPKTERWFLNRIGKRIYRDKQGGSCCDICEDVYQNGLIVKDKQHAHYLVAIDRDFTYKKQLSG